MDNDQIASTIDQLLADHWYIARNTVGVGPAPKNLQEVRERFLSNIKALGKAGIETNVYQLMLEHDK